MRFSAPRWHWLYFVLAAFDVSAVCVGLYLNHAVMDVYKSSVAVNQTWAERGRAYSQLGELASAVNAPGNDVFLSRDPEAEGARMREARRAFDGRIDRLRGELRANVAPGEAGPLLDGLGDVAQAMSAMTSEARFTFSYFRHGQPQRAAERMAAMDERYAEVNKALAALRARVARIQQENFERQTEVAARLQRFENLIAVLILLMVVGATLYGHRLARHMQAEAAARERALLDMAGARVTLQDTNARLQALFRRTLEMQEDERRHIARELHEEVAQMLGALKFRLESLGAAPSPSPDLRASARDAGSIADSALHRLQDLASDLAPHGMQLVGLPGVLSEHLRQWTRGSGLAVHFDTRPETLRAPPGVETAAYRIAEEAVRNALRHAVARTLRVDVLQTERELQLDVTDDGVGFDARLACSSSRSGKLGITLMEQRALLAGGVLAIASEPGRGTVVRARFPLASPAAAPST